MKTIRNPSMLLWLMLSSQLVAQNPQAPSSRDVDDALLQYHSLCTNVVAHIQASCTETNVLDVFPMYLAGWLHSSEAVPEILSKLELPGANEPGTRKIAKRPPGGFINPIVMVSAGVSPTPPTPASGALTLLPISFSTLTNAICDATVNTNRVELLAWSTSVKYHDEFQTLVETEATLGKQPWRLIRDVQANEWESDPSVPINIYRQYFPEEDVSVYTNIFHSLRSIADYAETAGNSVLSQHAKSALLEIGHPFDEDPSLWPQ